MRLEKLYPFGEKQLVFGLEWQPLLDQAGPQQAALMAKQHKAKAWVIAGHTFMNIGLSYSPRSAKKVIYAAAACYALLHPKGWYASIYQLEDEVYWLAVVHEGTPMSLGDRLFSSEQEAQTALLALAERYSDLSYTDHVISLADFLTLIATHTLQKNQLQSLRFRFWRPFLLSCAALSAMYWLQFEPAPEVAAAIPDLDPYLEEWQQRKIQPNGKDALRQLILSWEHIPLRLQDWQLQSINCEAQTVSASWDCEMRYGAMTDMATAMQLQSVLPASWHLKEVGLQSILVGQQIDFMSTSHQWRNTEQVRLYLLSQLQHIRPAFSRLSLAEPIPLRSGVPPSRYAPIFSQGLSFEGPLRSLALLMSLDEALDWQRVSLTYQPQRQPSLKSSALQASIQGVIYVRD